MSWSLWPTLISTGLLATVLYFTITAVVAPVDMTVDASTCCRPMDILPTMIAVSIVVAIGIIILNAFKAEAGTQEANHK